MHIVIAGASGFIGRPLVAKLRAHGHQVCTLVRSAGPPGDGGVRWNPEGDDLDQGVIDRADAVINFCGHNIAGNRWTDRVKDLLVRSRLQPTRLLAEAIRRSSSPPEILVNASATGFYGDRGDEELDEESSRGSGFLADLAGAWEEAAASARSGHTRVVALRFGMVVGTGGAVGRMAPIYKLGLGGPIASGRQYWPWIAIDDVLGGVEKVLTADEIDGPVNLVSPLPTRCSDLSAALGRALRRPAFLTVPGPLIRLVVGEMADHLLLASARVRPTALAGIGYEFVIPDLDEAFRRAIQA